VYARATSSRVIEIARHSLLPIDFRYFARPLGSERPITTLAPAVLLERLAAEYVYAQLCEAATRSFAAENEARMTVMAAAKTNIETKLATLSERERALRQEQITAEVVELAAGTEALNTGPQLTWRS
jgi:F-type H+-transporting ATPase subunit gamma